MNATLAEATSIAFAAAKGAALEAIRTGLIQSPATTEDAQEIIVWMMSQAVLANHELNDMYVRGMAEHCYDLMHSE